MISFQFNIDLGVLDHMSNTIPIGCLKVAVPRQVHIVITLQGTSGENVKLL